MFPMRTGESIDISLEIKKLGEASLNYVINGYDSKKNHCFHVDQVVCFVDVKSFEPVRILPELRQQIQFYQKNCGKILEETGVN